MLKLIMRPLPRLDCVDGMAANPAYLHQQDGLRLSIYAGIGKSAKALYAGLLVVTLCGFWLAGSRKEIATLDHLIVAVAPILIVGLSFILIVCARKIASARIHFVPLGDVFPTISEITRNIPKRGWPWLYLRLNTSASINRAFDFDLAVRVTEPNVNDRLTIYVDKERYVKKKGIAIDLDGLDRDYEALMTSFLPAKWVLKQFAERQAEYGNEKRDLSPIARLIISRVLYRRPDATKALQQRKTDELAAKPEVKGAHYYLAFKLNLVPIAIWLLLISLAIIAPTLALGSIKPRDIAAVISVLIIIWGIWTLVYNRGLIANWKHWLAESGERPLGNLPLFLYIPANNTAYKWEELDAYDFKVFIDEYLMDTSTAYQLIVGFFMGTAFTLSRVLV